MIGPSIYRNWIASNEGIASQICFEYPFYTDAEIVGEISTGLGPYQLIHNVPFKDHQTSRPTIIFRTEYHLGNDLDHNRLDATHDESYHGGYFQDEMAALVALCLGIRLKSGDVSRIFENGTDSRGRPVGWSYALDPVLPRIPTKSVLPRAIFEEKSLESAYRLTQLPVLFPQEATALVRAARLYQDGLWIAESQPELSWLMLVSAIETIADCWRSATESPLERLRASRPELENLLREKGDEEFVVRIAEQLAPYMGATKKFVDFVLEFLPEPPAKRPSSLFQLQWNKASMKQILTKIYSYRSKALHGGKPFPAPMCEAPPIFDGEYYSEKPIGMAVGMKGSSWLSKDLPMYLFTFECITQKSILKWWDWTTEKRMKMS